MKLIQKIINWFSSLFQSPLSTVPVEEKKLFDISSVMELKNPEGQESEIKKEKKEEKEVSFNYTSDSLINELKNLEPMSKQFESAREEILNELRKMAKEYTSPK